MFLNLVHALYFSYDSYWVSNFGRSRNQTCVCFELPLQIFQQTALVKSSMIFHRLERVRTQARVDSRILEFHAFYSQSSFVSYESSTDLVFLSPRFRFLWSLFSAVRQQIIAAGPTQFLAEKLKLCGFQNEIIILDNYY